MFTIYRSNFGVLSNSYFRMPSTRNKTKAAAEAGAAAPKSKNTKSKVVNTKNSKSTITKAKNRLSKNKQVNHQGPLEDGDVQNELKEMLPLLRKMISNYEEKVSDSEKEEEMDFEQEIRKQMDPNESDSDGNSENSEDGESDCDIVDVEEPARFTSVGFALDSHVSTKLRAKIISGSYVDYKLLLPPNLNEQKKKNIRLGEKDQKITLSFEEEQNKELYLKDWHKSHAIFTTILVRHYKSYQLSLDLLKYASTITRLHAMGGDWSSYDKQFRLQLSCNNTLGWNNPNWELWQYSLSGRNAKNPNAPGSSRANLGPKKAGGTGSGRRYCYAYNDKSCSFGQACKFQHVCAVCRGSHPRFKCQQRSERTRAPDTMGKNENPNAASKGNNQ